MTNGVVAMVDGKPITLAQLRRRAAPHVASVRRSGIARWAQADAVRKVWAEVLESMIDDALLKAAASRAGITVSDKEVDEQVDRVAAAAQLSREAVLAEALALGMTGRELRDDYRRQIVAWRVMWVEYSRTEGKPLPVGDGASEAVEAYRKQWLANRRREACVENRLTSSSR